MISHYDGFGTMCGKLIRTKIFFIYTVINNIDNLMGFIWRRRGGNKRRGGGRRGTTEEEKEEKRGTEIRY